MSYQTTKDVAMRAKQRARAALLGPARPPGGLADSLAATIAEIFEGRPASGPELLVVVIHVVTGAAHGVSEAGANVGTEAAEIVSGVLRGARRVGRPTLETVHTLANTLVRTTAGLGEELIGPALGAVEGTRRSARELFLPADAAAGAAAAGALRAARDLDPALAVRMREALGAGTSPAL